MWNKWRPEIEHTSHQTPNAHVKFISIRLIPLLLTIIKLVIGLERVNKLNCFIE